MLSILIAALYAAQAVTGARLPRHEGHDDPQTSPTIPTHYVYITDYTTVCSTPSTATISPFAVPSSPSPPIEYVYITEYTTVYADPSTSVFYSTLSPKLTETLFITVTAPLNATASSSPIAWNSTSHYVYASSGAAISTTEPKYDSASPTSSSSSVVSSASLAAASSQVSTLAACRARTRTSSSMVMMSSSSQVLSSSVSLVSPTSSTIPYGESTPLSSTPAASSTAVIIQPIPQLQLSSTAIVVIPITPSAPSIPRSPPLETSIEDTVLTIQTAGVPDALPTFVVDTSTIESTPSSKSSSEVIATPSHSVLASVGSADPRCPYPYPGVYCGEVKTTVVVEKTRTKKEERPSVTQSARVCPYPGQRC